MDKESLLASLTGDQLVDNTGYVNENAAEQDLFGDIAVDESTRHAVSTTLGMDAGSVIQPETMLSQSYTNDPVHTELSYRNGTAPAKHADPPVSSVCNTDAAAVQQYHPVDSLLSKSGLLGVSGIAEDSGGLFDEVDKDEQKEAEVKTMNEQRLRKAEMEERQKQEAEAQRKHEEEHYRLQQQEISQNSSYIGQDSAKGNPGVSAPMIQHESSVIQSVSMPQRQLNGQLGAMTLNTSNSSGFYREHNTVSSGMTMPTGQTTPTLQNTGGYFYGTQEQQIQYSSNQQQQQYSGNFVQPSSTVGMHNATQNMNLGRIRQITLVRPQEIAPLYIDIRVTEPMLIQTQSFLISSPPYWSYQITSQLAGNQGTWLVRRRFRHVVALEDRLRQACPGSIIPPRPEKHATRALEEASTQQSAEFAVQRAKELEQYLNHVACHPVAGHSQALRLFLGLQDDIGTAWPEVSTNALTRLQAVGAGVTMRVAESTSLTAASAPVHEWEENAELLSLCSSESLRLGAVSQAVPKLEGTVIVLRERGDAAGILGMELSKASKTLDLEYKFLDILSSGLLRHGRRTKRLAVEMSAAMESFLQQYKLVRYEKMAMQDRRQAIQRKAKERGRADARAVHLGQQQRHLQVNGQMHHLSQLEQNAIAMDNQALDAVSEADEIGARLKLEINRVAIDRRIAWNSSVKTIASSMKEACSERVAIWESTFEAFQNLTKT